MGMKLATVAFTAIVMIASAAAAAPQDSAACDQYAKNYAKQVSSGAEVVGGAAIGAIGGAVIGGLIGGSKGAGTGALIGGGTGAVGGAATHARNYQDAYNYAYTYCMNQQAAQPQPVGGLQPWTQPWFEYCSSKYRSFNPQTGYYTTYGGEQRFCQ
ncbi:BA14K family protein [Microbaculum marinum]|uniref:Lectin-like protein BA14k n=1 Tax=Microbaculum marinum TaxID=1764581 RepID=A0AAW9RVS0_9HYPH